MQKTAASPKLRPRLPSHTQPKVQYLKLPKVANTLTWEVLNTGLWFRVVPLQRGGRETLRACGSFDYDMRGGLGRGCSCCVYMNIKGWGQLY